MKNESEKPLLKQWLAEKVRLYFWPYFLLLIVLIITIFVFKSPYDCDHYEKVSPDGVSMGGIFCR